MNILTQIFLLFFTCSLSDDLALIEYLKVYKIQNLKIILNYVTNKLCEVYVGPVCSPGASKCVDINLEILLSQSKYFTAWIFPHPLGQAPSGHTGPSYGYPCSSHPAQLRFDRLSRVLTIADLVRTRLL